MANTIGIDFGTTKTMVSYLNPATGRVELVRLGRDKDSIPTTIHVDESGEFLFGEDADDQIETDPEGYCRAFKLHLGEKDPVLPRANETAESLAARFLRHIKSECEQSVFHGEAVTGATITVPVSFAPARKAALKRAAEAAGFYSVSFLPEPEAAGTAFLRDNPADKFSRALVLDWGGGTLDIAIISRDEDGTIHADRHCAEGRDDVGGEEMDRGLLENLKYIWEQTFGSQLPSSEENEPKLLRESEKVKIGLSRKDMVPFRQGKNKIDVTRNQFRQIVEQLLQASVDLVNSSLSKNRAQGHLEPDAILLIGGTCQSPVVRETMEQNFPNFRVLSWHHSHEAIALGATATPVSSLPSKAGSAAILDAINRVELIAENNDNMKSVSKTDAILLEQAANTGNPKAMMLLGCIYRDGCQGVDSDSGKCLSWLRAASAAGDADSMASLAVLYLGAGDNPPVARNLSIAQKWANEAVAIEPNIQNLAVLTCVLASFDEPNWSKIRTTGDRVLKLVGDKPPDRFSHNDAEWIGTVCFWLACEAAQIDDEETRVSMLEMGKSFGNEDCASTLADDGQNEGSFTVTDEAIRLLARQCIVDGRRNPAKRRFVEEWCPDVVDNPAWIQSLRPNEDVESLAVATADSYRNNSEELSELLVKLQELAACDGPPTDDERYSLSLIRYCFGLRKTRPRPLADQAQICRSETLSSTKSPTDNGSAVIATIITFCIVFLLLVGFTAALGLEPSRVGKAGALIPVAVASWVRRKLKKQ